MNILSWLASLFSKPVPHDSFPTDNTGVLHDIRDTDWVAGSIPFEVRNASGDWRAFLPTPDEVQNSQYADSMACVSFSLTNSLEIQAKKLTGKEYNWSDRYLAKLSGTTKTGNFQYKVADAVRAFGLVNQETWPTPLSFTWDTFYSAIPTELVARAAAEFPFSIAYEWISTERTSLLHHLQHAPIQMTIPGQNPFHAVCLVAIVGNLYYYYDSYAPFLKTMSGPPATAMKIVLNDNRIIMRKIAWNDSEKGMYVGFDTLERQAKFVAAMQTLFPDYRIEEKDWNLGKRPW